MIGINNEFSNLRATFDPTVPLTIEQLRHRSAYFAFLVSPAATIALNVPERADTVAAAILGYN